MTTEKEWQRQVVDVAILRGWKVYHTFDSRHSEAGFPDLVLLRGDRQLVVELKVGDKNPTAEQIEWLNAFEKAGVDAQVWRSSIGLHTIAQVLK